MHFTEILWGFKICSTTSRLISVLFWAFSKSPELKLPRWRLIPTSAYVSTYLKDTIENFYFTIATANCWENESCQFQRLHSIPEHKTLYSKAINPRFVVINSCSRKHKKNLLICHVTNHLSIYVTAVSSQATSLPYAIVISLKAHASSWIIIEEHFKERPQ